MKTPKVETSLIKFKKALLALEAIASQPMREDKMNVDATIQRFEFTFELFWKLLKSVLEAKGAVVTYPREVLQQAYQGHLIDNEEVWIKMLQDRNLTSHTYNEDLALQIFKNIQSYVPVFRATLEALTPKL